MGKIKCPKCGKTMSKTFTECIYCGNTDLNSKWKIVPACICCIGVIVAIVGIVLSISKSKSTIPTPTPIIEPVYKHEEFNYDGKVKWNTSYTEILKMYGKPDKIYGINDRYVMLRYYDPIVAGYTFYEREFEFDRETGRLKLINLSSRNPIDFRDIIDKDRKLSASMLDILKSKYGNPDTSDGEHLLWTHLYADTSIDFWFDNTFGLLHIYYKNLHDYSNENPYRDIPTFTPEPTSTPINYQGL